MKGFTGIPDRVFGFIQCGNVRDFMAMATMKCWSERDSKSLPPMFLKDTEVRTRTEYSSNDKNKSA
jgi:hypothetical protein